MQSNMKNFVTSDVPTDTRFLPNLGDEEEQIDTEEDEVFRNVTQKICQSTIGSSASSLGKQQGRRRFDQPSDSGIHLFPSEHEDVDGSLTSEEFPSARQYLASLGVVRPTTTKTVSEDFRRKSCHRKLPLVIKTSTTPRTSDVSSKMTPTMNRTTAALENYLDEQDDAASADGVDVRELIYSKISEVLADGEVENLRNLPDVARLEATTMNRNSVKFKIDHQKQNPREDQRKILGHHSRQSSSQSNGSRSSVHWSTHRKPSVPAATPSSFPAIVNSPHGNGRSPSNNIFSSSSKKEPAAANFVFPPISRTISPLPVPKLCARRRCSNEMSPSQQRNPFAYKTTNKIMSEHFDV
uniref:Uncharacterized protein n=1 Tax=Romanomermis culicivorax TaxID=13658 RepID=A0A915J7M7_ROMCU